MHVKVEVNVSEATADSSSGIANVSEATADSPSGIANEAEKLFEGAQIGRVYCYFRYHRHYLINGRCPE